MERLILCGAGHVSLELAHIASRLDFEIVVIDDRPEFANTERFPMAARVICAPYLEGLAQAGSTGEDYFVLLSRSHDLDRDCLSRVLRVEYAYVGMIGSPVKVKAIMASLEEEGFAPEVLRGVHSPIGLKIGGQTPAEIGVSIAAELVQERSRRGKGAGTPPDRPGVVATIVAREGPSPREVGTWMHVAPDGTCTGTIGGGAAEFMAREDALALWPGGPFPCRKTYDRNAGSPLGMACGGRVTVEFTAVPGRGAER